MHRLLTRLSGRLSLFWRYFFLLVAVVILFLGAFSAAAQSFSRSLQSSYLSQSQAIFEQNSQTFSQTLFSSRTLPLALENNDSYAAVSDATQPFASRIIPSLLSVRDSFAIQCSMLDLPSECFLLFDRSDICMTRELLFLNGDECFSSYLVYEDGGVALRSALEQPQLPLAFRLLPSQNVSVNGAAPAPYMTALLTASNGRDTYGFLYPAEAINRQFHLSSLPDNTSLQLTHSNGTVLFSHGQPSTVDTEAILFTATISDFPCTATMGVPRSFFRQTLFDALALPLLIFALCVIIGIALCFLFSHISAQPFRRLIRTHSMDDDTSPENELLTIDSFLRTTQQRAAALHDMLLSSLLARAFAGQPIRQDEYQTLSVAFPQFQQPQRAAIVRDRNSGSIQDDNSMLHLLRTHLPEQFLCEYISPEQALVLFPAEPPDFELLQSTLTGLNTGSDRLPRFFCGVSAPFIGLNELTNSLRQAQFCISETSRRAVIPFSEDAVGTDLSSSSAFDLKRFQQALAAWNQRELTAMLDQAHSNPGPHPEELFYSILFLLRDAALSGNMTFASPEKCTYLPSGTPAANLHQLQAVVDDLFRQKSALQLSDKQQLCGDLVGYIRKNFSDPTLCLFSLSHQFEVSERFTHNAIQTTTGMNFSNFLLQCRMQEAARLLQQSDISINDVAEQCGYPAISTFYRNFKKYYQMTPADFKDSVQAASGREKEQL